MVAATGIASARYPRTHQTARSRAPEQFQQFNKPAEQDGEAAHAVAGGVPRQREVRAGALLNTGEAAELPRPEGVQPARDTEGTIKANSKCLTGRDSYG